MGQIGGTTESTLNTRTTPKSAVEQICKTAKNDWTEAQHAHKADFDNQEGRLGRKTTRPQQPRAL